MLKAANQGKRNKKGRDIKTSIRDVKDKQKKKINRSKDSK
jgi:hypothetical protein